ncbi:MAG: fructosamine kinase family protein [Spirochaetales bacterium]|nr:fructosamine kinase family protein [Spirochaetales bacterium]
MDTPVPLFDSLNDALAAVESPGCSVSGERGVGGGCISSCGILTLDTGRRLFIKRNGTGGLDMFCREAAGLSALAVVDGAPGVPQVLAAGTDGSFSFLLMEYLESASRGSRFWETFGRALALMHQNGRSGACGFHEDNYIGASPQLNTALEDWIDFFRIRRIEYQLKMARDRRLADRSMTELVSRVMERLDRILIPCDSGGASLLHGDLWSGNYITGPAGEACIIDPAVYYGHREADLAMTRLFGGYDPAFYSAYNEAWPLEPGAAERSDLYNLYHMLNHLNLFGGSYAASVLSIARKYS